MRRVAVLGSTGSIGCNTLEVIAAHPERLQLVGVAARSRLDVLAAQVQQFQPAQVCVWSPEKAQEFAQRCGTREVLSGPDGLLALATHPSVDVVVIATSGRDALIPLIRAIQAGKRIALASKELLVMAGELIMRLVEEHGANLVPIDSEHAALLQCLQGVPKAHIVQMVVTGSGGPLWALSAEAQQAATREQVLAHPKWRMGPKITVDSATLMNKGLEIIEARWLFGVPLEKLRVVIHPEAAVHALIELVDGSLLAQMSRCDMRVPIQYALSFPERWDTPVPRLSLTELSALRFFEPDLQRFPCLQLAGEAARAGGTACVALNGANEVAVQAYLSGHLRFGDIPRIIEETLRHHAPIAHPALEEILQADVEARRIAEENVSRCCLR